MTLAKCENKNALTQTDCKTQKIANDKIQALLHDLTVQMNSLEAEAKNLSNILSADETLLSKRQREIDILNGQLLKIIHQHERVLRL